MANHNFRVLNIVWLASALVLPPPQTAQEKRLTAKIVEKKTSAANGVEEQRRAFAVSLINSLTNEAREYVDQALASHVLARSAYTLWDADTDTARQLFRRAWEIAEKRDAEESALKSNDKLPSMVASLRNITGSDLRLDVLNLAARCDSALGEEFLNKLKEDTKRDADDIKNDSSPRNVRDSWSTSEIVSKRLQLARRLLDDGQIDRAQEIAAPVLNQVNANSILFISALRQKRAEDADQRFAFLVDHAEFDPSSDANTVSGLSSYVFTPGLYVTFSADGNVRWSQPEGTTAPPNLPAALRNRFFQAAASILLRPQPPPDRDFTSSGRTGTCMVINRLLPLFDQHSPDMAVALRSHLKTLTSGGPGTGLNDDTSLVNQGLRPAQPLDDTLELMQNRLAQARSSRERDRIYADAAVALANQGDIRAQTLVDKIEDSDRRTQVRRYVDFQFVQLAIRKKDSAQAVQLAKAGQLTHTQRVWTYTQAARLLMKSETQRAQELLEEAATEARRIDPDDPDRARSLIGVATQFVSADRVRAWEVLDEAVKAANSSDAFTGENVQLHFSMIATISGVKISSVSAEDFKLTGVMRSLAKEDLYRSISLAKSFKNNAPRAAAMLAIAGSVLER